MEIDPTVPPLIQAEALVRGLMGWVTVGETKDARQLVVTLEHVEEALPHLLTLIQLAQKQ